MQFHSPSEVQGPDRAPPLEDGVLLEDGLVVAAALDVAGLAATELAAAGLGSAGLDASRLEAAGLDAAELASLGAAVTDADDEMSVDIVVGIMGIPDADELENGGKVVNGVGSDAEVISEVVMKTPPPELGLVPPTVEAVGVSDGAELDGETTVTIVVGRTTPGLVVGMVTELANEGSALCWVEEVAWMGD